MKRMFKYLGLAALGIMVLTSCNSKSKDDYTSDDINYQVSEEEFKNMYNFGTEYSCDYKFYSGSTIFETISLKRDNNKIMLSNDNLYITPDANYYSIVDGNTYRSIKYESDTYEDLGNFDIADIMPKATGYISMDDIYDNVNFDSKSNEYILKNYKNREDDIITYEMHFKFENKKLSFYKMLVRADGGGTITTSSKVTTSFKYDDQDIQFPEEVISMLND